MRIILYTENINIFQCPLEEMIDDKHDSENILDFMSCQI